MYKAEQEVYGNRDISFTVEEKSIDEFIEKYGKIYDLNASHIKDKDSNKSRIYIYLKDVDKRIIQGLAPIFEIALENSKPCEFDEKHLKNYRDQGFVYEEDEAYINISLGDSNDKEISLAGIVLYFLLLDMKYLQLSTEFEYMKENICRGGFNSAIYNGLEGYYYSKYFVKWLLDFKEYIIENPRFSIVKPLYDLVENLENPLTSKLK
ncbi:MAG: hypothetical protein Q4A42_00890 [Tissierellia bacterium]|nr:hypothetical protein [Tissierellia bacterium]